MSLDLAEESVAYSNLIDGNDFEGSINCDNSNDDIIFLDKDVAPATTSPVLTRAADVPQVQTQLCDDVDVKPSSTEDSKMTRFLLQD
ncbi:hypothetical protein KIN20_018509 [Parelaphostrongylus tenuis]|uniref:Uncharacterized protein n=1 Tax=Parelaphostrongylus tenuis TaxID=148309 RepID=A0AAD5QDS0_PARTN|nr:hypothetical protein KIN20_003494 [Parelaphostrongylus tenuis]KAJ1359723.1 hypothetical protein KIN20_018509 [Parelaphostrongylus tenuis]